MNEPSAIKHLGVPMPIHLREALQAIADNNDRSAAAEARVAIREYVEKSREAHRDDAA